MDSRKNMKLEELLEKPVWQMTGEELTTVIASASSIDNAAKAPEAKVCVGMQALAENLSCCVSTLYTLKNNGVLDDAIISQIGKKIVFDVEKARVAANEFQMKRRFEG